MIKIRDYEARDRDACMSIFASNTPLYFDPSERLYLENWLNAKDEGIIAYAGNTAECFFVLEQDEVVIGCAGFYVPAAVKEVNMVWGMVENLFHKKGFGKRLLIHRIQLAKMVFPDHKIILDTSQHTFKFFEGLGFKVVKITQNSYGPGLDRYDMVINA